MRIDPRSLLVKELEEEYLFRSFTRQEELMTDGFRPKEEDEASASGIAAAIAHSPILKKQKVDQRDIGLVPFQTELPQQELPAAVGYGLKASEFVPAVQMSAVRAIPGLDKATIPIAKVLGKFKTPWVAANKNRIANNLALGTIAKTSRREIQRLPGIIEGQRTVPEFVWGLGLMDAEAIPEVTPSADGNIVAQALQEGINNIAQDALEGRAITQKSTMNNFVRYLAYVFDDATRSGGYAKIKVEIDPWMKSTHAPEVKVAETRRILTRAVTEGKISKADVPGIMKLVGAVTVLRAIDPIVAQAFTEPLTITERGAVEAPVIDLEERGRAWAAEAEYKIPADVEVFVPGYPEGHYTTIHRPKTLEAQVWEDIYVHRIDKYHVPTSNYSSGMRLNKGNRRAQRAFYRDYAKIKGDLRKKYGLGGPIVGQVWWKKNKERIKVAQARQAKGQGTPEDVKILGEYSKRQYIQSAFESDVREAATVGLYALMFSLMAGQAISGVAGTIEWNQATKKAMEHSLAKSGLIPAKPEGVVIKGATVWRTPLDPAKSVGLPPNTDVVFQRGYKFKLLVDPATINLPQRAAQNLNMPAQVASSPMPPPTGKVPMVAPTPPTLPTPSAPIVIPPSAVVAMVAPIVQPAAPHEKLKVPKGYATAMEDVQRILNKTYDIPLDDVSFAQVRKKYAAAWKKLYRKGVTPEVLAMHYVGRVHADAQLQNVEAIKKVEGIKTEVPKVPKPEKIKPPAPKIVPKIETIPDVELPVKKLPNPAKTVSASALENGRHRFAAVGREGLYDELTGRVRDVAEYSNLRTPSQRRKVQEMVMIELSRATVSKSKGRYTPKYTDDEVKALAEALAKRDVEVVRDETIERREGRRAAEVMRLEERGLHLLAHFVENNIVVPIPNYKSTGEPVITEDYLAIPPRFRELPRLNDANLKRDKYGNYVVPKKYWAKPGTRGGLDLLAQTLYAANVGAGGETVPGEVRESYISEPGGDALMQAVLNESRAYRSGEDVKADEEKYYQDMWDVEEAKREQIDEILRLVQEGKHAEASKLLAESGIGDDLKKELEARMGEDPFEAPTQAYLLRGEEKPKLPEQAELRVEGKGTAKETEKARAMEAAGQLVAGKGVQKSLIPPGFEAEPRPKEKGYDGIVWAKKVHEYLKQGMVRREAARRAMVDAKNAYVAKKFEELAGWPTKAVQKRAEAAVRKLGVAEAKIPEFLSRYGKILRSAATRYRDVDDVVAELQRFGVDTELKETEAPLPKRSEKLDILNAESAASIRADVAKTAQVSANTEKASMYDQAIELEARHVVPAVETGVEQVIIDGKALATSEAIRLRLEEILMNTASEEILKGRVTLDNRMGQMVKKGKPWSVAVLNIGRMGEINEAAGWMRGDLYMAAVFDGMKRHLPRGSTVGRYSPNSGEVTMVIPRSETLAKAAILQAVEAVKAEVKAPDGKPLEVSVGLTENRGEATSETIAEAAVYARDSRKLGRNLVVEHEIHEKYQDRLKPPEVAYRPEAVEQTLNVDVQLKDEGFVDVRSLEIKTPADIAEVARQLTDPSREKLGIISLSEDNVIQGVSVAALGDMESVRFDRFQKLPAFAPHLLMGAKKFFIFHNHPSGDPRPTKADIKQYEFLRTYGAHLGLKFMGGIAIGDDKFSFVEPAGLSVNIKVQDIPEPQAERYYAPMVSATLESGKHSPVTDAEMPGFIASALRNADVTAKAVYAIPLAPDGSPRGVFKVTTNFTEPHHVASEVARIATVTLSSRVVLASGDNPAEWKENLALINHDLDMQGIRLLDAMSVKGESFKDFESALPDRVKWTEAVADASTFRQPVRNYDTPNTKFKYIANLIAHYVLNFEDVAQRLTPIPFLGGKHPKDWMSWTNWVDEKEVIPKLRKLFFKGLERVPLGKTFLRAFSTTWGRPEDIIKATDAFQIIVDKWIRIGKDISKEMNRKWTNEEKILMQDALQGKAEIDPKDSPKAAKLFDATARVRNKLIEAGFYVAEVSERTGVKLLTWDTFLKNFGKWLPRMYKFYELRTWTPEEWRYETARKGLMEKTVRKDGSKLSQDEADAIIGALIAEKPVSLYTLKKRGEGIRTRMIDFSVFAKRKSIPSYIRVLLGEIRDAPGYVAGKGVITRTEEAAKAEYFTRIAASEDVALSAKEWGDLKMTHPKIALKEYKMVPSDEKFGPLAGMYLSKPVYDDVLKIHDFEKSFSKGYRRFLSFWKALKVPWNPPAFSRNIVSDTIFAEMFGDLPFLRLDFYAKSIRDILKAKKGNPPAEYQKAEALNLFKQTFAMQEITKVMEGTVGARSLKDFKNRFQQGLAKVGEGAYKTAMSAGKLYGEIEDFFKYTVYLYNRQVFNKTPEQAVKIGDRSLFNYSSITRFVNKIRSSWWGNPFVTFQTKWIPEFTRAMGRKPLTVLKWLMIPTIITSITLASLGISRKEYREMKKKLPLWQRNNPFLILIGKDKYGRLEHIDGLYIFPWGAMMGGVAATIDWGVKAILGGNPLAKLVQDVVRFSTALSTGRPPRDDYFGYEIWDELDPPEIQLGKTMKYFNRQYGPTWMPGGPSYERVAKAISQTPDYWGRTWTPGQAISYQFGMKVVPMDVEEVERNNLHDHLRSIRGHEGKMKKSADEFYRQTGKHIKLLTDDEREEVSGHAKRALTQYDRQADMLDKVLNEAAEYFMKPDDPDYNPQLLSIKSMEKLTDEERLKKTSLQRRSYELRRRMREEIDRLNEILNVRYPKGIQATREEMGE